MGNAQMGGSWRVHGPPCAASAPGWPWGLCAQCARTLRLWGGGLRECAQLAAVGGCVLGKWAMRKWEAACVCMARHALPLHQAGPGGCAPSVHALCGCGMVHARACVHGLPCAAHVPGPTPAASHFHGMPGPAATQAHSTPAPQLPPKHTAHTHTRKHTRAHTHACARTRTRTHTCASCFLCISAAAACFALRSSSASLSAFSASAAFTVATTGGTVQAASCNEWGCVGVWLGAQGGGCMWPVLQALFSCACVSRSLHPPPLPATTALNHLPPCLSRRGSHLPCLRQPRTPRHAHAHTRIHTHTHTHAHTHAHAPRCLRCRSTRAHPRR